MASSENLNFIHLKMYMYNNINFLYCSENQLKANESFKTQRPTKVFCLRCPKKPNTDPDSKNPGGKNSGKNLHMTLEEISEGSVVISNANLELVFDEETHLLKSIKGQKLLLGFTESLSIKAIT